MAAEMTGQHIAFVAGTLLAALDLSDTMVFPFLAEFLMAHGVVQSSVGLIIGMVSVGICLVSPCMGSITVKVGGASRALAIGALLFCVVRILTALLPFIPDGTPMLVSSCAIFFITGCVYALSEIGALSWVLATAPSGQKIAAMAVLVSSRTLGMMLGTPVGGILFDLMGWSLTNVAGALILLVPLGFYRDQFFGKPARGSDTTAQTTGNALNSPKYVIVNIINLIAMANTYVIVPYMQPYFATAFGTPKWGYGVATMFCLFVGFMGGSALSVELEKALGFRAAVLGGSVLVLVGFLLIGPSPFLHEIAFLTEAGVWAAIGGLAISLMGNAILIVLTPTMALQYAQEAGLTEEEASIQTSSLTVFISAVALFLGPVTGSLLADTVGVPWTNTIVGAIGAAFGVATVVLLSLLDKPRPSSQRDLV